MRQRGQGILSQSEIYFSSPSMRAEKLLYHVLCTGHFYCDDTYTLTRDCYDSFLVLHVIKGSFSFINTLGKESVALPGETVILDCYKPHTYCTHDNLESVWFHVAGANSRQLCDDIVHTEGNIIRSGNADGIRKGMFEIFEAVGRKSMSENDISLAVYRLMLKLSESYEVKEASFGLHEDNIQKIREYIHSNLNEDITVKSLADMAHMSVTHFSRVFKKRCGFSPYDYVLEARLNRAKELLLRSDMTVTDITYETGFNSEANFVYCFTKNVGISPGKFRKTGF
ncbi:MAG: helix-turn-helix transcriptional regulator [Clostridia bacterium]|nr:helix-turn-helix transcriptional regulator [Clostridia bacterium]